MLTMVYILGDDSNDFVNTACQIFISQYGALLQILSQAGYEPLPATPTLSIDCYVFYPSPVRVFKTIVHQHGVRGLFCGVLERFVTKYLRQTIDKAVAFRLLTSNVLRNAPVFWQHAIRVILAKVVATVACHPLRVITVRKILQLVGGESVYNSPLSAVREIYRHEGVLGFFSGLVPSLGYVVLTSSLMAVAQWYSGGKHEMKTRWVNIDLWSLAVTYVFYPLGTVSTVMMAAGSRLQFRCFYQTWLHCLVDLVAEKRIFRGAYTM